MLEVMQMDKQAIVLLQAFARHFQVQAFIMVVLRMAMQAIVL